MSCAELTPEAIYVQEICQVAGCRKIISPVDTSPSIIAIAGKGMERWLGCGSVHIRTARSQSNEWMSLLESIAEVAGLHELGMFWPKGGKPGTSINTMEEQEQVSKGYQIVWSWSRLLRILSLCSRTTSRYTSRCLSIGAIIQGAVNATRRHLQLSGLHICVLPCHNILQMHQPVFTFLARTLPPWSSQCVLVLMDRTAKRCKLCLQETGV